MALQERAMREVMAVLQSATPGLPLQTFLEDFEELTFRELPYRDLGHASPTEYLETLGHVVSLTIMEAGEVLLDGVVHPATDHIRRMVAAETLRNATAECM